MNSETEIKIKEAAHKIFKTKGFAATRTRDIAQEAGVNLASLNYYFKSKELLFNEIMFETINTFKKSIVEFVNDDSLDFMSNLQRLIDSYTQLLLQEPELSNFVLGELAMHREIITTTINPRNIIAGSTFEKQMKEYINNSSIDASQLFINIMALIVFPFVGKVMFQNLYNIDDEGFKKIVEERKPLIPKWIEMMINSTK